MLHQMFDRLHVPYHRAPGEAEAQCARLQQLGVVDAVWSDDGDCLMFGCTTLIKAHRNASGKKEWDRIQVYKAETLLPRFDFDTDSLVMFAVVSGGDYDDKGLPGCGHQTAKKLVRREVGLAASLRKCNDKKALATWRNQLAVTLRGMGSGVGVPLNFPDLKAFNGYREPAVSEDERCRNLRGLHVREGGWDWWENQMDQTKLRVVLRDHYNFKTREFLGHLAPVFLARALTRNVTPARREENLTYGVALRRTMNRKGKNGEDLGQPAEINIKFNAASLVQINLAVQPLEEDWSCTVKNDGIPYDPMKPIDGEMLSCFLEYGLPEGALDKPTKSPKKQGKKSVAAEAPDEPGTSQAMPAASQQSSTTSNARKSIKEPRELDSNQSATKLSQHGRNKKRKSSSEDAATSDKAVKKQRKSKAPDRTPSASPPPAQFKRLQIPNLIPKDTADPPSQTIPAKNLVIDLDNDTDSDGLYSNPVPTRIAKAYSKQRSPPVRKSAVHERSSQASMSNSGGPTRPPAPTSKRDVSPSPRAFGLQVNSPIPLSAPLPATLSVPPASSSEKLGLPASSALESDTSVTPSAASLRQKREAGLLSKLSNPLDAAITTARTATPPAVPPAVPVEVIDLT